MLGPIPLITKTKIGGAFIAVEESGTPGCGAVALQFGAGTWPDRLNGFNRFGITQEIVKTERHQPTESSYCSFMTTSREGNLSQAEQSFRSSDHLLSLTIGYGQSTSDGCSVRIEHETVPATLSWFDCPKLIDQLRKRQPAARKSRSVPGKPSVLPTFLYVVREAILSSQPRVSARYTHNGGLYNLTTEKRRAGDGSAEYLVAGRICEDASRRETNFRLWLAPASDPELPVRIEFRARSFLKLLLEKDDRQNVPVFKPILKETES